MGKGAGGQLGLQQATPGTPSMSSCLVVARQAG